jgi:[acyl-carrier-protein] S-malonyltransferase
MPTATVAAFVFPGQGSQYAGMGFDLYNDFSSAREVFEKADAALKFPLSQLCFRGPEEELKQTINVQPAILTTSIACLSAAQEVCGDSFPSPAFVAGHSLGEYAALVAAKTMTLTDAVQLVRERGRLMQRASKQHQGGMLAIIGLDKNAVEEVCLRSGCEISNINSPGQIVISGSINVLPLASKLAKTKGPCRVIPLKVGGAFHSRLMQPIADEFRQIILNLPLHPPVIPLVANMSARPASNITAIQEELCGQLCHCVQWQSCVEYMTNNAVSFFYEIGPGRVLSNLIKHTIPNAQCVNISNTDNIRQLAKMPASR